MPRSAREFHAQGRRIALAGRKHSRRRTVEPFLAAAVLAGQAAPRFDAHKMALRGGRAPKQRIRIARNVAGDIAARILFVDAELRGGKARHAEAVVVEQAVGQRDARKVAAKIIAAAAEQTVGQIVKAHGAFHVVEAELIILGVVLIVERNVETSIILFPKNQKTFIILNNLLNLLLN